MSTEPLKLFYSYAHADESLLNRLNDHLAGMQRQGLISTWNSQNIAAGGLWEQEIDSHLKAAQIILLLISPSFLSSSYCYGFEMQEALKRHDEGKACVIPVILRPCDWENAPFRQLQALPRKAKPVTLWSNRDSAYTDIAKGIRRVIEELNGKEPEGTSQVARSRKSKTQNGEGIGGKKTMVSMPEIPKTPTGLSTPLKKAVERYYKDLKEYEGKADYELALKTAFQTLLAEGARQMKWTLIPEETQESGIRPDGVLRDNIYQLRRGYWEAKGPKSDLDKEIAKKIAQRYPLTNTIFENTRQAVLYQNGERLSADYNLLDPRELLALLRQFLTYTEPDYVNFEAAVQEFKESIPDLAKALLKIIEQEQKVNKKFIDAFVAFATLCRTSLDPQISMEMLKEMLVQHLLTERLIRTVFNNPDFVKRNVIAAEIEKVIDALTSKAFSRQDFLKPLDRFYIAIEETAKGISSWSERQHFLNTVYERFFQGFSVKQADTHGIVYTPQEIVDFMCASVNEVLKRDFGTSIEEPGVQILDPATGTGSFIVNLMNRIPAYKLTHKYKNDLFCNEIMLLPYYVASLNIEHEYYARMKRYESFEGICFADTLELAEKMHTDAKGTAIQSSLFLVEENTKRVEQEKSAEIMVVIGNPPYNVGQKSENDNNKNRKYPLINQRIRETYTKDSNASNKNALSDAYVKFFRWAVDRLGGRDGIVCLVTNNSFIDQVAFDGMRKHLQKDFTRIYHVDLHGNVRQNPKLSGTTHNVFGIQIGIGITLAVRVSQKSDRAVYYHRVPEFWRKTEKLAFLHEKESINSIDWQKLQPDEKNIWITEGLQPEFASFLQIGEKGAKELLYPLVIFKNYGGGVKTNRDLWTYDFDPVALKDKIHKFVETYNNEVDRWKRRGSSIVSVDDFVTYEDTKIKWSRDLKLDLQYGHYVAISPEKLRESLYRPFCKQWLFFDRILNEEVYQLPQIFPKPATETENIVICLNGIGSNKPFHCLAAKCIPDIHLTGDAQCFPYYTYSEDGTSRRENITDWALKQFQAKYGPDVTKWDIFHYVYAMLHHPQYRERYAENLKRDLPRIPLLHRAEAFSACVSIGKQLMDKHLNYEQARDTLQWFHNEGVPFSTRVEKMRLSTDKRVVVVNESLRIGPIPEECFEYRLGNRSALEWVIDQYQVSTDKRSGIESDPNRLDDEEYIVRLVGKVVTVSVETVGLVKELAQRVAIEDWMEVSE